MVIYLVRSKGSIPLSRRSQRAAKRCMRSISPSTLNRTESDGH